MLRFGWQGFKFNVSKINYSSPCTHNMSHNSNSHNTTYKYNLSLLVSSMIIFSESKLCMMYPLWAYILSLICNMHSGTLILLWAVCVIRLQAALHMHTVLLVASRNIGLVDHASRITFAVTFLISPSRLTVSCYTVL